MRIVGIAVVKNEADIIEAFVRHNRALLDALLVVDNESSDATRVILKHLAEELPGVGVGDRPGVDHQQQATMTEAAQRFAAAGAFDVIIPLDGDELIWCQDRAALERAIAAVPAGNVGVLRWITYVPRPTDDLSEPNLARRITHYRSDEQERWHKVVIPVSLARQPGFAIGMGNHRVVTAAGEVPGVELQRVRLAHFPVRSPEQVISKALLGSWAIYQKHNRLRGECRHWHELAARFEKAPLLSREELEEIGARYAADAPSALVLGPLPAHESGLLRYPKLAEVNPLQRVAAYAGASIRARSNLFWQSPDAGLARTDGGVMAFSKNAGEADLGLELYGVHQGSEVGLLEKLVGPGQNALLLGAGIGTLAIPLARAVGPSGRVFAVESDRRAFHLLCGNAALNGLGNVVARQLRLGDGEVGEPEEAAPGEEVPAATVDSLGLPPVKLLVVEGGPFARAALRGARSLVARDRPTLFVRAEDDAKPMVLQLRSMGYRPFWNFCPRFVADNVHENQRNVFAEQCVNPLAVGFVAVHRGMRIDANALLEVRGPDDTWREALARATGRQRLAGAA